MMKKIFAIVLALLLALCATACSQTDPDAPEDMKSATAAGEPFRLYVPTNWSENTVSGISGAYLSSSEKIMVTARYVSPEDANMTLDAYMDYCSEQYAKTLKGFVITDRSAALLGGENAVKLSYKMTEDEKEMTCFQITALYRGDMVSLNGYCPTERYEAFSADFDKIISSFVLCEKGTDNGQELVDKNTPDGMEIASADQIEYRFYVPKAWVCNADSGVSEAYYPESGKPNVTVTSYAPETSISVKDYFLRCEEEYKTVLPAYERTAEPAERTVSGRSAYTYTYTATVEGTQITIMQTLFAYNEHIYSITYTALTDRFSEHLADVNRMMDVFTFR
ncbi:MAG: DcrB-related protein [Clostridia bacterium]|nr:DcrB-related protein [Clostridia bacterium]